MSQKVPVGAVLNEAVQFGLHRWLTVIRFAWLPVVVMIGLAVGYAYAVLDMPALKIMEETGAEPESISELFRIPVSAALIIGLGLYLVLFLLVAGIATSVYRLVALGEERPGLFHLRFDGPVWRVFWAYIILAVINLVIWAVATTVAFSMTGQSLSEVAAAFIKFIELAAQAESGARPSPETFQPFIDAIGAFIYAGLIALIPLLYVNIKLTPFIPGSASENRLLLFGSFRMTFGHFWSILGIYVLLVIFIIILGIIFQLVIWIFELVATFLAAQGAAFAIVGVVLKVVIAAATIFYEAFMMALQLATAGIIYRRLKTGE